MERTKKCSKCGKIKPISDFSPNGGNKIRSNCKQCEAMIRRERRQKNRQEYNLHRRQYNAALSEERKARVRAWHRNYYREHREDLIKKKLLKHKMLLACDPVYAEKQRLHGMVNKILHHGRNLGEQSRREIEEILGCPITFFKIYFFNTWEKEYGKKWDGETFEIDHIAPLNNAKTIEEVKKLFHYKNLRCLTPFDNKSKYIN